MTTIISHSYRVRKLFDFRKCDCGESYTSINIHWVPVEVVNSFRFLGVSEMADNMALFTPEIHLG